MSGIRAIYRLLPELSSNPREIHFDKKITFISQAANWKHSHSLLKSCKNKYYLFLREVSLLLKRCFSVFCFNCVNYLLNKSSKNRETSSSKRFSFHSFNRSCLLLELKRLMFANRLPTCYLHKLYLHVIPKSHTKQIAGIFAWHGGYVKSIARFLFFCWLPSVDLEKNDWHIVAEDIVCRRRVFNFRA